MDRRDTNRFEKVRPAGWPSGAAAGLVVALVIVAAGCKSDLNQQLLERELRYQEDQIYYLQDELEEKQSRLAQVAGENTSLRRQLGVGDSDDATPARGGRTRSPRVPAAAPIPSATQVPDSAPRGGGPPIDLSPPTLEGVPALPAEPVVPPATRDSLSLPPAAAAILPAAKPIGLAEANPPALVRLSYEEPAGQAAPTRLVVKTGGEPGTPSGLFLAVEPRDSTERLVAGLAGDVIVTAFDTAASPGSRPLGRWVIPAADAMARFRPTGRRRGIPLDLPWQGTLPAGDHVRIHVQTAMPSGMLETEALVPVR